MGEGWGEEMSQELTRRPQKALTAQGVKAPQHRKALPYDEVAGCIAAVHASRATASTKLALEFIVLTAARSGEVRKAHWNEIDLEAMVWEVPAERMKMKRPHRVPMSPRAVGLLHEAKALEDGSGLRTASAASATALSGMSKPKTPLKRVGKVAWPKRDPSPNNSNH